MAVTPFTRYMVFGSSSTWWENMAPNYLRSKGWNVIKPKEFIYEKSYGFQPINHRTETEVLELKYRLSKSSAVVEYRGAAPQDSVFYPNQGKTLIDDLLAFMSIYTGIYWQFLWKERRDESDEYSSWLAERFSTLGRSHSDEWAGSRSQSVADFEGVLGVIPQIDPEQLALAMRWFSSSLREFEVGRPLVEAALNWVCLESQANFLGINGNKRHIVEKLIAAQGFANVPKLGNFYKLRNDAFHDGALSNLDEVDAQPARTAGRFLVRAQILNLMGIPHSDFREDFTKTYLN